MPNVIEEGSVQEGVLAVEWKIRKPTSQLIVVSCIVTVAAMFFGITTIRPWIGFFDVVPNLVAIVLTFGLCIVAFNLLRAMIGPQVGCIASSGGKLRLKLGFPYFLLDREQQPRTIRDMLFLERRRTECKEDLSEIRVHPFQDEGSLRVRFRDGSSLLVAKGKLVDAEQLAKALADMTGIPVSPT